MNIPAHIDAFELVRQKIPAAIDELSLIDLHGIMPLLESRYRQGNAEHRNDWVHQSPAWFDNERAQEIADAILYGAMRMVIEDAEGS